MKHLFNDLSSEEKNAILEQHKGGKVITNENFNKLSKHKSGNVKLIKEQSVDPTEVIVAMQACFASANVDAEPCINAFNEAIKKMPTGTPPNPQEIWKVMAPCINNIVATAPMVALTLTPCLWTALSKLGTK
jgi:hypothetical protein